MTRFTQNTKSLLGRMLLLLFLSLFVQSTLFLHTHSVGGVKITHSHIYFSYGSVADASSSDVPNTSNIPNETQNPSPFSAHSSQAGHTHSKDVSIAIALLGHVLFAAFLLAVFFTAVIFVRKIYSFVDKSIVLISERIAFLRGPPSFTY